MHTSGIRPGRVARIDRVIAGLTRALALALALALVTMATGCSSKKDIPAPVPEEKKILLGFSQIGAESAWRMCNTRSVKEAATEYGIQLIYENAEQKQENQIKALRSFIAYQVDVIAFVPIVTDGWDNVLQEAKDAGIPVLITDRKINTSDPSLFAGFIGTDSHLEGRNAARFIRRKFEAAKRKGSFPDRQVRILELTGTEGSSVAMGRGEGFRAELGDDPGYAIAHSESGDFLRSKGYELMLSLLREGLAFDAVFSHNDSMTLGVIDALKIRGIRPGKDIMIVSIDAEQAAIDALRAGEVNCVIECNPKTGPVIMELATKLARNETIPRLLHVDEQVFTEDDNLLLVEPRGY